MVKDYRDIDTGSAYRLLNHGPLVLVSTVSRAGDPDIAPIAWSCPVMKSPAAVLAAISTGHRTFSNIEQTGIMTVCIPHISQKELAVQTGSTSGKATDKFDKFDINFIEGPVLGCRIPTGCVGYIECRVKEIFNYEGKALVIGEGVGAAAAPDSFDARVRPEDYAGRTLHHLGGSAFAYPKIIDER